MDSILAFFWKGSTGFFGFFMIFFHFPEEIVSKNSILRGFMVPGFGFFQKIISNLEQTRTDTDGAAKCCPSICKYFLAPQCMLG